MTLGNETAADIDRNVAAERGDAVADEARAFAATTESVRLVVQELSDAERVVHLSKIDVARHKLRALVHLRCAALRDLGHRHVAKARLVAPRAQLGSDD